MERNREPSCETEPHWVSICWEGALVEMRGITLALLLPF